MMFRRKTGLSLIKRDEKRNSVGNKDHIDMDRNRWSGGQLLYYQDTRKSIKFQQRTIQTLLWCCLQVAWQSNLGSSKMFQSFTSV